MLLVLSTLGGCPGIEKDTGEPADTGDTGDTGAPACTFLDPGDRLDLEGGCVDGVCLGSVYTEVVAVWGEPGACAPAGSGVGCEWGDRGMTFPDCDDDGAPDAEYLCDLFDQSLVLFPEWDGASAEGLGLGVTAACWESVLGAEPERGWEFGSNPWWNVTVDPDAGPVTTITFDWTWDE